jgi:GrpB-like predicted nucleotidyltransferase (UPF0157 family)
VTNRRKVEIVDYDPAWAKLFAELSDVVGRALGDLALAIEHVGSTSVPGLAAKPIVDLIVVIPSRDLLPAVIPCLATLGYEHEGDLGVTGREAFRRPSTDVPRDGGGRERPRHHLYVCAQDSQELARMLAFRDVLRQNPAQADAYAQLKQELARRYPYDVNAYAEAKTDFVEGILTQALDGWPDDN